MDVIINGEKNLRDLENDAVSGLVNGKIFGEQNR